MAEADTRPTKYAIVGAGPAGLVTARAFLKRGIEVELIERHDSVGGIWNIEQPGSPMYRSCNFISSRRSGAFIGYPMPSEYPLYPRWDQIRDYVHSFAAAYGLDRKGRFNTEVMSARSVDAASGRFWQLEFGSGETADYRGVVSATGSQWQPSIPSIPGLESFPGRVMHSAEYLDPSEFAGKRVLVVGAGNSGVDIVVDAAFHGSAAYLSTRRGYWFLPKVMFGYAVPDLLAGLVEPGPGSRLSGLDQAELLQAVMETVGDLTVYGLPAPDHEYGASHPILNNQVLHCLAHGILEHRTDLEAVTGSTAVFADGTRTDLDVIVFATGYDAVVPWLPENAIRYDRGHPQALLGSLLDEPGLYLAGALHFAEHTFPLFDRIVQVVAADADAELTGRNRDALHALRRDFRPDLTGGFGFLDTRRNVNQIDVPALEEAFGVLSETYGIEIPKVTDTDFYADLLVPQLSPVE